MIVALALIVVLLASTADAVEFRAATHGSLNPSTTCTASVPSGTQNGDLLLALALANQSTSGHTITAPTGWTEVATHYNTAGAAFRMSLFRKIASNESGSYQFTSSENVRFSCTVTAWYDGINTTNPIAQHSNTAYTAHDTTIRAAGLTTTAPASLLFIGTSPCNPACSITPPTSPAAFTEQVEYWDNRHLRYFAALNWTSAGATGNVDGTLSGATTNKHAFLLELSAPGGSGVGLSLRRRLQ